MKYTSIIFCILVGACSSSADSLAVNPNVTDFLGTRNYLKAVAVSGSVLQTDSRFLSYTKRANRISIINPEQKTETWSKSASGFEYAVVLPDFLGATLFAVNRIVVMSGNVERTFLLQSPYAHASAARNKAAYSVASIDGTSIEVIRSLGFGQWQHDTFDTPWPVIDPGVSAPPDNQPVLLVTQFNHEGTLLAVFSPSDGRYAIYTAPSISSPISTTTEWCSGDGIGTQQNASFQSLVWDEDKQRFFAGDKAGQIYAIDPYAACPTAETVDRLAMPENSPIVHIALLDNGELGVIQRSVNTGTLLGIVSFNSSSFSHTGRTISVECDRPLSAMTTLNAMDPSLNTVVVMCEPDSLPQNGLEDPSDLLFSDTEPYLYLSYDYSTGSHINTLSIDKSNSSGIAIDKSTNTLHRIIEGAFGTLQSTNLQTGESTTTVGLYLHDLLE